VLQMQVLLADSPELVVNRAEGPVRPALRHRHQAPRVSTRGCADWVVASENIDVRIPATCRGPASWRSCLTASARGFQPCMYASDSIPPLVLTGSLPPIRISPALQNSRPSPGLTNP